MGLPHVVNVLKGTATRVKGACLRALVGLPHALVDTILGLVGRRVVVEFILVRRYFLVEKLFDRL